MANAAAYASGLLLGKDLSHQTSNRWQVWLRAALVVSIREWMVMARESLLENGRNKTPGWKFIVCQYRSDATNAQVWQRSKLHVSELSVTAMSEPVQAE